MNLGKNLALVTLTFQNSLLILIMHYSRVMPTDGDHRYFPSTAVFLTEVLKLIVCLALTFRETAATLAPDTPPKVLVEQVYNAVFAGDGWKLAVPAAFYTLQNLLQYVAISNLDAVQFQVLYQFKILTTAIFSVYLLRRSLGVKRWLALLLLTIGVSIVSLPPSSSTPQFHLHDISDHFFPSNMPRGVVAAPDIEDIVVPPPVVPRLMRRNEAIDVSLDDDIDAHAAAAAAAAHLLDAPMNYSLGVTSILIAAAVSGLTSVYFEKILKDSGATVSIWVRNTQMAFYSLLAALIGGVLWQDGAEIAVHGFFEGYNWVVWTAVLLQTFGGIVASLVIRDTDNIVKTFATSISIVISFLISVYLFDDFSFGLTFLIGTSLVLFATYLYGMQDRLRGAGMRGRVPPPIKIANFEKPTIEKVFTPGVKDNARPDPLARWGSGLAVSTSRPSSPMLPRQNSRSNFKRDD
ncbi:nucleotide-sugar transporter [Sarocladium strictum]